MFYSANKKGGEQINFHGTDPHLGPVLVTIRDELDKNGKAVTQIILRLSLGTFQQYLRADEELYPEIILEHVKTLCPSLSLEFLTPIISRRASNVIEEFDQKASFRGKKYKFGLLYQKKGQFSEDEIFKNQEGDNNYDDFLDFIGKRQLLKGYEGFTGGLDTKHDQTGTEAIFATFEECEIVFHVATLLPHSDTDKQQLAKKRHIGNDIVAIVFQESGAMFSPSIVSSQFLHSYIVIQPAKEEKFMISIVTKADVPDFEPSFQYQGVHTKTPLLRQNLLSKLINAELACYKSSIFLNLEQRTRYNMLHDVSDKLLLETNKYLKPVTSRGCSIDENVLNDKDKGLLQSMCTVIRKQIRSKSLFPTSSQLLPLNEKKHSIVPQIKLSGTSSPVTPDSSNQKTGLIVKFTHFNFDQIDNSDGHLDTTDKEKIATVSSPCAWPGNVNDLQAEIEQLKKDKREYKREIDNLRVKQEILERKLELTKKMDQT